MAKDSSANGNGKNEEARVPFKRGERERHLELLAKNILEERRLKGKLTKTREAIERCVEDIEQGGYMADLQGTIPGLDHDDSAEARS